jgi:hypothetical protein
VSTGALSDFHRGAENAWVAVGSRYRCLCRGVIRDGRPPSSLSRLAPINASGPTSVYIYRPTNMGSGSPCGNPCGHIGTQKQFLRGRIARRFRDGLGEERRIRARRRAVPAAGERAIFMRPRTFQNKTGDMELDENELTANGYTPDPASPSHPRDPCSQCSGSAISRLTMGPQ